MTQFELFKRGDEHCSHVWGGEQVERRLDQFFWWRVCTKCGERRATRMLSRGPSIEIWDHVSGIGYVIGSRQNLARKEFRFLRCDCGNSVRVDFELRDDGRVVRRSPATCEWCGARYDVGSGGPAHRPRGGFWKDAPKID